MPNPRRSVGARSDRRAFSQIGKLQGISSGRRVNSTGHSDWQTAAGWRAHTEVDAATVVSVRENARHLRHFTKPAAITSVRATISATVSIQNRVPPKLSVGPQEVVNGEARLTESGLLGSYSRAVEER